MAARRDEPIFEIYEAIVRLGKRKMVIIAGGSPIAVHYQNFEINGKKITSKQLLRNVSKGNKKKVRGFKRLSKGL